MLKTWPHGYPNTHVRRRTCVQHVLIFFGTSLFGKMVKRLSAVVVTHIQVIVPRTK